MNCLQQRFAIQWYLARPCIISGQDARTTRNFGIFFQLEVSKTILWAGFDEYLRYVNINDPMVSCPSLYY
jgi:hypothetical protein